MYFSLMGKLNARRKNLTSQDDKGFTLIELLVVVIIIGILAAIAIPVYLGVQNNAKDSGVKSDITNLKTAAISLATNSTSAAPSNITFGTGTGAVTVASTAGTTTDWSAAGATLGDNTTTLQYGASTTGFCIIGVSSTKTKFYATDASGVSTTACTIK